MRSRKSYRSRVAAPSLGGEEVSQPFGAVTLSSAPPQERNPRILRVLWWSMPVVLALVVAGSLLVGLYLWSASTLKATARSDWSQAHMAYEQQMSSTQHFPQPWLSQYNFGTVLVDEGRLDEGLRLLEAALVGVPKARVSDDGSIGAFSYECSVRFNFSGAVELQGDDQVSNGDEAGALETYERALELVAPCQIVGASGDSTGQQDQPQEGGGEGENSEEEDPNSQVNPEMGQQTGESADRLKEKIEDLSGPAEDPQDQGDGEGGEDGQDQSSEGGEGVGNESPEEAERREELEAKNREQEERQREKEESYNRNPGTGGW